MVIFDIKCSSDEQFCEIRDKLHDSLVGTPAYIDNQIVLSDYKQEENIVSLFIGKENSDNIAYEINANDLKEVEF